MCARPSIGNGTIGFTVIDKYDDGGDGLSFAILSFGSSQVMSNSGWQPSASHRREVDLYLCSDNVDDLYQRLKDRVEILKGLNETFTACESSSSATSIGFG